MGARPSTPVSAQKAPPIIVESPPPSIASSSFGVGDAQGCAWNGQPCRLAVAKGISSSGAKLMREQGTITQAECARWEADKTKVRNSQLSFQQFKTNLLAGVYYQSIQTPDGPYCRQIQMTEADIGTATTVDTINWEKARVPVIRKMTTEGGYSSTTKLFITPSMPFKVTLNGATYTVPRMTLYHPSPIRLENVQHDAILTLGDPSAGNRATSPNAPDLVVLVPLVGSLTPGPSGDFITKITRYLSGVLSADPVSGQFPQLDIPTGNDWDLSKVFPGSPSNGETVVNVGYFVWSATPPMVRAQNPTITQRPSPQADLWTYPYVPAAQSKLRYVMLQNPVSVGVFDLQAIRMLPATPAEQAIDPVLMSTLSYVTPTSCSSTSSTTRESMTNPDTCDPFAAVPARDHSTMLWAVLGTILSILTLFLGVLLAVKLLTPERRAWIRTKFAGLGKAFTDMGFPSALRRKADEAEAAEARLAPPPLPVGPELATKGEVKAERAKESEARTADLVGTAETAVRDATAAAEAARTAPTIEAAETKAEAAAVVADEADKAADALVGTPAETKAREAADEARAAAELAKTIVEERKAGEPKPEDMPAIVRTGDSAEALNRAITETTEAAVEAERDRDRLRELSSRVDSAETAEEARRRLAEIEPLTAAALARAGKARAALRGLSREDRADADVLEALKRVEDVEDEAGEIQVNAERTVESKREAEAKASEESSRLSRTSAGVGLTAPSEEAVSAAAAAELARREAETKAKAEEDAKSKAKAEEEAKAAEADIDLLGEVHDLLGQYQKNIEALEAAPRGMREVPLKAAAKTAAAIQIRLNRIQRDRLGEVEQGMLDERIGLFKTLKERMTKALKRRVASSERTLPVAATTTVKGDSVMETTPLDTFKTSVEAYAETPTLETYRDAQKRRIPARTYAQSKGQLEAFERLATKLDEAHEAAQLAERTAGSLVDRLKAAVASAREHPKAEENPLRAAKGEESYLKRLNALGLAIEKAEAEAKTIKVAKDVSAAETAIKEAKKAFDAESKAHTERQKRIKEGAIKEEKRAELTEMDRTAKPGQPGRETAGVPRPAGVPPPSLDAFNPLVASQLAAYKAALTKKSPDEVKADLDKRREELARLKKARYGIEGEGAVLRDWMIKVSVALQKSRAAISEMETRAETTEDPLKKAQYTNSIRDLKKAVADTKVGGGRRPRKNRKVTRRYVA